MTSNFWDDAEVIHTYTRADAIDDGTLIDVSSTAREAGIKFPTAITAAAWEKFVAWSDEDSRRQTPQDEAGRLWDVLWMLRCAISSHKGRRANAITDEIVFGFYCVPRDGRGRRPKLVRAKALCGPGDHAEPTITVMLTHED